MELLANAFNLILYQPLFNALILLYQYLPGQDFGLAVIVLTILIRILFYPLMVQSIRVQKTLSELQPKIQDIQKTYGNDWAKQAQAILKLYQKEKINPLSGWLPLLIQLPVLIALYRVFWQGLAPEQLSQLYSFVPNPERINSFFLGKINLAQPNLTLAFLAGLSQFFQSKIATLYQQKVDQAKTQFSNLFQNQMLYFFSFFTILILWKLPSALSLFWLVTSLFTIFQQYLLLNLKNKNESVRNWKNKKNY